VTPAGPVPLAQVARLEPVMEEPILWRRNREPFLTVRAELQPGFQAPDVTAAALPRMEAIGARLPGDMRVEAGGAAEESAKANASLFALFPAMVAAMLLILMVQLRHFGRMALVLATAPLGIPGAAAALLLLDMPFRLRRAARRDRAGRDGDAQHADPGGPGAAGCRSRDAAASGHHRKPVRRARPVLLTGLAAVLAFVPLTLPYSGGRWRWR
jgi:multidrug efflux pump subunit AcrB